MASQIANEAESYVRYVHQLVQAGLLGNDKNIEMFPFATLRWAQWKNALGKPTRMAINDQSLKGNWPVLALIQNSTKWWQYFFNHNKCTCMNFVFLWLCCEKHEALFRSSTGQGHRFVEPFVFSLYTIVEAFNSCVPLSKSIEHKIFIDFLNHLKAVDVAQEFPIAMEHANASVSRLSTIYRIYFGFGRTSVHDAKSFALDGTCTYEAYGTDLIAAIDCIWEKINGKNSEIVDLSKEQRNLQRALQNFRLRDVSCAMERLKHYKSAFPTVIEPIIRDLYIKKAITLSEFMELN
eukprot:g4945.t1